MLALKPTEDPLTPRCGRFHLLPRLVLLFLLLSRISGAPLQAGNYSWKTIDQGLSIGEFSIALSPGGDESKITVVKIHPEYYSFKLVTASQFEKKKLTIRQWSEKHRFLAAVNAGMYQKDGLTSVGFMKNYDHVNNPRLNGNKAVLAFNPLDPQIPEIQVIDRECQNFASIEPKYATFVQGIRMISCRQQNVWKQQPEKWSTVAIGTDMDGNALLLFCQSPTSVHDFIDMLLALPIGIHNAMYLEGGPQASLYVSAKGFELEKHGTINRAFEETQGIEFAWPIPNVIGIVRKSADVS